MGGVFGQHSTHRWRGGDKLLSYPQVAFNWKL